MYVARVCLFVYAARVPLCALHFLSQRLALFVLSSPRFQSL